ncbi:uncharacterized protein HD556DRAFT_1303159 [Suillus plorans]|uniref:Uncharacterized protein n=1 Tax=Suillus plorans TaxID=116603 RepID=A0A9P7J7J8_9AGAM|nr:uncharacterized protein HD556DRAFT_1303159 [Suillus plorans]KAG1806765.1 hypothetical protein HD556DRAFT_1303159 [Suillus plorans]
MFGHYDYFPRVRELPPQLANRLNHPERLVPIRFEFDVEHHKMHKTFVWNLNNPVIIPEHFAQTLVEDYTLPTMLTATGKELQDMRRHTNGSHLTAPNTTNLPGVLGESEIMGSNHVLHVLTRRGVGHYIDGKRM